MKNEKKCYLFCQLSERHSSKCKCLVVVSFVTLRSHSCASHVITPAGLEDYMSRYAEGIKRVLDSFGPIPDFISDGSKHIVDVSINAEEASRR